ncbi:CDT1-like protein a, chloroplastic [Silene latifolia]|uniref:CDT1-like protein a, chloroplastic n=1 Tax=Silene latifolia TaxID=37657 RepID=UPI003D76F68D
MASMKPLPSDPLKSPAKPSPSDQISIATPIKLSDPHSRTRHNRRPLQLPDKYEMLLKAFDALDASLKLLRLRKSVPVFSKVRVMIETISERRFTHQHLAQLKFLLPDEIGIGKVLFPDEETRCMKYDLHLTITGSNKRKRGKRYSCLRHRLVSRLLQFLKAHPEGTEIPEKELPEPFNQRKQDQMLNTIKQSSSSTTAHKYSESKESGQAQASHLSISFKKHFSKKGLGSRIERTIQSSSVPYHSPSISTSNPNDSESKSVIPVSGAAQSRQPAAQIKQKSSMDHDTCSFHVAKTQATPIKSVGATMMPATPSLQTPKMCKRTPDNGNTRSACDVTNRPSCARSLMFEGPSKSTNIELQLDEADCSDIVDVLPENLLHLLKEEEKKKVEQSKRKLMIVNLPKMFDRIQLLFQNPKSSAIRKEALIRNLTVCHSDITDESEIEEQLKLLEEIIPEWIVHKFSPSGNKLCSINKALNPNTLRQQIYKSI